MVRSLILGILCVTLIANAAAQSPDPCDTYENRNNCVFYARARVPSLPSGLNTYSDKVRILVRTSTPVAGDVAVHDIFRPYGHVSVVERVFGDGTILIREGNRPLGKVASRRGTPASMRIVGYWPPTSPPLFPLYRYGGTGGRHFYTTVVSELYWGGSGFTFEGIQCRISPYPIGGSSPLYRYYNAGSGDHFYTTNFNELGSGRYGYQLEWVEGHVAGTVPLYRYYHPGVWQHFYTTNWNELGGGRYGWIYEGVACYVW